MAVAIPQRYLFDVEAYHQLGETGKFSEDENVELIEGEIVIMPPIGSSHAFSVTELSETLYDKIGKQAKMRVQNPVQLGDLSEPQPDIVLVRRVEHGYRQTHPRADDILLLVEVADTTLKYDRETKILLYARYGISEVWLVNLTDKCVEVYREPSPTGYKSSRRFDPGESLTPINFPDMTIPVDGIF